MLRKFILMPLILICVAGCSTIHIESNKDITYQKPLNRVLICISLRKSVYDPSVVAKLLSEKLYKRGVLAQTIIQKDTESEDVQTVRANAINTYNPSQILTILTTEDKSISVMGIGVDQPYLIEIQEIRVDITVFDVALKKNIWRALAYNTTKPLEDSLTDTVIQKLDVDGLLPTPATANNKL